MNGEACDMSDIKGVIDAPSIEDAIVIARDELHVDLTRVQIVPRWVVVND